MKCLKHVIAAHRSRPAVNPDAMQIDPPSASTPSGIDPSRPRRIIPELRWFLADIVQYKLSPPALRVAIRKHIPDAGDVLCVLEVVEGWISAWFERDSDLGFNLGRGPPSVDLGELPPLATVSSYKALTVLTI
jgi:hypothetical protein